MFSVSRKAKNLCDVRIEKKGEKGNIISTKFEAKLKDNFKLVTLSLTIKSLKNIPKLYSGQWMKVSKKQMNFQKNSIVKFCHLQLKYSK